MDARRGGPAARKPGDRAHASPNQNVGRVYGANSPQGNGRRKLEDPAADHQRQSPSEYVQSHLGAWKAMSGVCPAHPGTGALLTRKQFGTNRTSVELVGLGANARWEPFDKAFLDETLDACLISSQAAAKLQETGFKQREIQRRQYRLRDGRVEECIAEIDARWCYAGTPFSRPQVFRVAPHLRCDILFGRAYAAERRTSSELHVRSLAPLIIEKGMKSKFYPLKR